MIQLFRNEEFKEIKLPGKVKLNYAVSNYGRLVSYENKITEGNELNGNLLEGYRIMRYKYTENGKIINKHFFIYKLVAEQFLPRTSDEQKHVLHLDYVRNNDHVSNLQWATYKEMREHGNKSPRVLEARKKLIEFNIKSDGRKLTSTQVIRLKKILQKPDRKTRKTLIAKQFNITLTQLKRIETGENWGHIKV